MVINAWKTLLEFLNNKHFIRQFIGSPIAFGVTDGSPRKRFVFPALSHYFWATHFRTNPHAFLENTNLFLIALLSVYTCMCACT